MARSPRDAAIARQQRRTKNLGQRHVGGVVGRQVLAEGPDPGKKDFVWIPFDREAGENRESLLGSHGLYFATQDKAAKHLSHLNIQEIGGVERRFRREEPFGQRGSHL